MSLGSPRPSNATEETDSRFLEQLEALGVEDWVQISRRFAEAERQLRPLARKAGRIVSQRSLPLANPSLAYHQAANRRALAIVSALPETVPGEGASWPLRSIARAALECGRCALKVMDARFPGIGQTAVAGPLLRPFEGFAALPVATPKPARKVPLSPATPKPVARGQVGAGKARVFHLGFEEVYFSFTEPPPAGVTAVPRDWYQRRFFHETWELPAREGLRCRFGGVTRGTCGSCGARELHHLITLPVLPGLSTAPAQALVLGTCLRCLGVVEPILYFSHRESSRLVAVQAKPATGPRSAALPAEPLRPTEVALCETPLKFVRQPWGSADDQNLNRIGGSPSWVQGRAPVRCPGCGGSMRFLLQLDSPLPTESGARWLWGSGGVLFVFWCDGCRLDAQFYQCS